MKRNTLLAAFGTLSLLCTLILSNSPAVLAQMPRINTFFPIGGKAGTTVEVEIRGSSLEKAEKILVHGEGVTGTVIPGDTKVDETSKPLWQSKCQSCHELRSPANRSLTPAQWEGTVERMVKARNAPLSLDEQAKVSAYLMSAARAGRVSAQFKIAPNALPGICEVRLVTARGLSTAALFEIGNLPEIISVNSTREQAQPVTMPCVANGTFIANGERHYFRFTGKQGQRLVFNLKSFRYADPTQLFFNPNLRLYDAAGKQIVENHGYYDLDPLIDWVCPADGTYTLEARDLLGRGNPGSVYRLTMGTLPYDTVLYPPAIQANGHATLSLAGKNLSGSQTFSLDTPQHTGLEVISTPLGPHTVYVSPFTVIRSDLHPGTTTLPAGFTGRIGSKGAVEKFAFTGKGRYEFEVFSSRLGSRCAVHARLIAPDGSGLGETYNDNRTTVDIAAGKTYTLQVEDYSGAGSAESVYFVVARPALPYIECVTRPDNVTLRPGLSTTVEVILTRRDGVEGNVEVSAEDLPPGVTAAPIVIQPDRGSAWLILTAAADAKPTEKPFTIKTTAHGSGGVSVYHGTAQEEYRLNNQQRFVDRSENVVVVRGQADFTTEIVTQSPIKVHPKERVEVKIKIKRRPDYKSGITFYVVGLPSGWTADAEGVGPDRSELTLHIRPDGNDTKPFRTRDPKLTKIQATVMASSDEYVFALGNLLIEAAYYKDEEEKK